LYEASEGGVTEQSKKYFNQSRGKNWCVCESSPTRLCWLFQRAVQEESRMVAHVGEWSDGNGLRNAGFGKNPGIAWLWSVNDTNRY
jgi:hypothetical protein